uniref:Uncharacterized protein n=1 Tax=Candidatus Kentrum sp. SD TaxID=2126332 RepID=A0A450YRG5_9GAMM|nr:MAG: hypothetical protein BECKSD772F_GA0070984_102637 [Candidatus Kentron sp. SD]VFK44141.1 MAG: hypothetical protein BECKSD772E_GA0070983_10342 [Candidatus Kentron sp. SD]
MDVKGIFPVVADHGGLGFDEIFMMVGIYPDDGIDICSKVMPFIGEVSPEIATNPGFRCILSVVPTLFRSVIFKRGDYQSLFYFLRY